jgi:hypothetical protein
VAKRNSEEKIGVHAIKNGKPGIVGIIFNSEYTEIKPE